MTTLGKSTAKTRKCGDADVATDSTSNVSVGADQYEGAVANRTSRLHDHGRDTAATTTTTTTTAPIGQGRMTMFMDRRLLEYCGHQHWFISTTTAALWMGTVLGLASLLVVAGLTERLVDHVVPSWSFTFVETCQFYLFEATHLWNSSPYATLAVNLVVAGTLGTLGSWVEDFILDCQSKGGGAADLGPLHRFLQRNSPHYYPGPTARQMISQPTSHHHHNTCR
jgi:hypothetical protein